MPPLPFPFTAHPSLSLARATRVFSPTNSNIKSTTGGHHAAAVYFSSSYYYSSVPNHLTIWLGIITVTYKKPFNFFFLFLSFYSGKYNKKMLSFQIKCFILIVYWVNNPGLGGIDDIPAHMTGIFPQHIYNLGPSILSKITI